MKRSATLDIGIILLAVSAWTPTAKAATDADKQAAIRTGLAYLYKTQQSEGFWSYPGYEHAATGAASFALLSQQNRWDSDAALYQAAVDKAISYLLNEAHITDVSSRDDGANICPGGDASCKGIAWYDNSADSVYTTGFVAPAIATYGLKAGSNAIATSTGPLAGMTWGQIAQSITNAFAASQRTSKNGQVAGAWRLAAAPGGSRSDKWTTQPPMISFLYDQLLGAVTPQVVRDGLKARLPAARDASGAMCYEASVSDQCELINVGEWLLASMFAGDDVPAAQADAVLAGLNMVWPSKANSIWYGNFGHPYAMWAVYAGLQSAIGLNDSTHITNFLTDCGASANKRPSSLPGNAACTWAEDYNQWLVNNQKPDGSWDGYSYWTGPMATALAINVLGAVEIPRSTYKCPLRQAFWQNPRAAWPVDSLSLGSRAYSKSDLLAILSAPIGPDSSADASLVLVDELITAKLNMAHGSEKAPIINTVADADMLLNSFNSRLPYHIELSSAAGQKMIEEANLLDRYNSAAMTPGCTASEARNEVIRNRQPPDRQTQQSSALVSAGGDNGAVASIGNSQRAHAAAASSKVRPFPKKGATSITLSPDENSLATASTDNTVRIFDAATGQQSLLIPTAVNFPTSLAFSPDGATLDGVGKDSLVHVWSALNGSELANFTGQESALRAVATSPNSQLIASSGEQTRVMLWDAVTHKLNKILYGSTDFVNSLSFSPDSTLLAAAGEDERVLLFDVAAGKIRFTLLGHSGPVDTVAFSPDGKTLASAGDDTVIHVWDAVNGVQLRVLAGHQAPIRTVAFSPDGKLLASGGEDTRIILWDAATGAISNTLSGSTGAVNALVFSSKGPFLYSATDTGEISVWNTASGKQMFTFIIPI